MIKNTSGRECGGCTACCRANPVPELGKLPSSPCDHCVSGPPGRCEIYEKRPKSCEGYSCSWLTGVLPLWAKPSETGLIADLQMLSVPPIVGPRLAWVIKEIRPNAAGTDAGMALIALLGQTGLTGAQGIQVAEAGNIPLILVTHDAAPGQGRVIEGIIADTGASTLVNHGRMNPKDIS